MQVWSDAGLHSFCIHSTPIGRTSPYSGPDMHKGSPAITQMREGCFFTGITISIPVRGKRKIQEKHKAFDFFFLLLLSEQTISAAGNSQAPETRYETDTTELK